MFKRLTELIEKGEDEALIFDDRYSQTTKTRIAERKKQYQDRALMDKLLAEQKAVIDNLKQAKIRAKTLHYYDGLFTTNKRFEELKRLRQDGQKIIGTMCNLVPEELIYAAGAIPVRLCSGCESAIKPGEEAFPRDSCPLIKSAMGFAVTGTSLFSLCDAIIIPATCDGKKKLCEIWNEYVPVWPLSLPQEKERSRAKQYWQGEVRVLKKRLERLTGNRVGRKQLKDAILRLHQRHDVIRRLLHIRSSREAVITGQDSFLVMQACFFDDLERWTKSTSLLCDELEAMRLAGKTVVDEHAPRILLAGAPFILPNFKIPQLIESHGAIIAIDETCAGTQYHYDPVEVDEWSMIEMMHAIAERYLMPSVCPCFIKSEDRLDKLLDLIKKHDIDAVVYHTLRLCLLFDVESFKVREVLRVEGVPFLHLNTDYSQEDVGQLLTRIEAFIEIIKGRP